VTLKIYNTFTRRKEEFAPLVKGQAGMYVCGPTVYGDSHVGHAKSYVSFDLIIRYLRYLGLKVLYVQNITDVGHLTDDADEGEDKIEQRSKIDRIHPMQIAETYTRSYFEDMDAMNVVRPDISPRATGHIIEQIELIKKLIEKGFAYVVNGSVYFEVSRDKEYGKLSGRKPEELEAGTRVDPNPEKRHQNDFALWKKAGAGHLMQWPSPWGLGFPGWHVECSAMSMKYLGETFDIHGGGLDNQFPHHESEIAQSECATGKPFVKYWVHNNLVTVGNQKMGKSLGNVILLKDAFKSYSPLVIRFFILQSHYRSTLDFSTGALDGAAKGWEKLVNTVRNIGTELSKRDGHGGGVSTPGRTESAMLSKAGLAQVRKKLLEALDDDFNAPQAIAGLFDLSRDLNNAMSQGAVSTEMLREAGRVFSEFGGTILGILPGEEGHAGAGNAALEADLIQFIIDLRTAARAEKMFSFSDRIRDGLAKLGVLLEDKKDGTVWKKAD
jgi:cysteinyl-tRNA synthetase